MKRNTGRTATIVFWTALALTVMSASVANAALNTLDIGLSKPLNGEPPGSGQKPWVDVQFQDLASPNTVRLTITAPNLRASEQAANMYLNFNPGKNVGSLVFTPRPDLSGGASLPSVTQLRENQYQAGSRGGDFDIKINFDGSSLLNGGETAVYDITVNGAFSLSALDFAFRSYPSPRNNPMNSYYAASTIDGGDASGWIAADSFFLVAVPEPASGLVAAGLCLGGGIFGLRKSKRIKALFV